MCWKASLLLHFTDGPPSHLNTPDPMDQTRCFVSLLYFLLLILPSLEVENTLFYRLRTTVPPVLVRPTPISLDFHLLEGGFAVFLSCMLKVANAALPVLFPQWSEVGGF